MKHLISVIMVAASAGVAAADPLMIHGRSTAEDMSEFIPTGENSGVLNFAFEFADYASDDASDPLIGAKGPCFGLGKANAGLTSGEGYCHFADASNEQMVIHWSIEPTAEVHGAWQFVGGTGRWAKAVGGGIFVDSKAENGATVTHFDGQVEFN